MGNVLEERLSTLLTKIFLYQLHSMGGNINSVNVFFSSVCTTATETLVMQRTTFLCLYLVCRLDPKGYCDAPLVTGIWDTGFDELW